MEKQRLMTIQSIYRILVSVFLIVTGVCLIVGCLMIYRFGAGSYSREAVAEVFSVLALPICISPVLAILGFVWECITPYADKKKANKPDTAFLLARMYSKKDTSALGADILAEQKKRKMHLILLTAVLSVASLVCLVYACNGSNFDRAEINQSMIRAMYVLVPCFVISFACGVFVLCSREKSLRRELELAKQLPNAERETKIDATVADKYVFALRLTLLAVALLLLGIGVVLGGEADVLTKAINICTECIGLG